MSSYNKVITTINNITSDYTYIPTNNNFMVIDTSNNRLGINIVNPEYAIDVCNETIRSENLIVTNKITALYADISDLNLSSQTLTINGIPALSRDTSNNLIIGNNINNSIFNNLYVLGDASINNILEVSNNLIKQSSINNILKTNNLYVLGRN